MTTDSKPIEPALSAEEWETRRGLEYWPERGENAEGRAFINDAGYLCVTYDYAVAFRPIPTDGEISRLIALANAALPDDSPYKITRADVEFLRNLPINCDAYSTQEKEDAAVSRFDGFVAKLAALLPPNQ